MPDPDYDIYPSEKLAHRELAHLREHRSIVVSVHLDVGELLDGLVAIGHTGPIDLNETWTEATGSAVRLSLP